MSLPLIPPPDPSLLTLSEPQRSSGPWAAPHGDSRIPVSPDPTHATPVEVVSDYGTAPTVSWANTNSGLVDWTNVVGDCTRSVRAYARF